MRRLTVIIGASVSSKFKAIAQQMNENVLRYAVVTILILSSFFVLGTAYLEYYSGSATMGLYKSIFVSYDSENSQHEFHRAVLTKFTIGLVLLGLAFVALIVWEKPKKMQGRERVKRRIERSDNP